MLEIVDMYGCDMPALNFFHRKPIGYACLNLSEKSENTVFLFLNLAFEALICFRLRYLSATLVTNYKRSSRGRRSEKGNVEYPRFQGRIKCVIERETLTQNRSILLAQQRKK